MMSTPSAASCRAIRSFSSIRIEKPGACSPSRSVVSKMISRSAVMVPPGDISCTLPLLLLSNL
jgi:hypothetical protein